MDTLLSDAPSWLLPRYGTIVVASELQASTGMGAELADKLRSYVLGGGRLVITAGSVRALSRPSRYSLFGIEVGACRTMPAGTEVRVSTASNTSAVQEAAAFELCEIGFGGAPVWRVLRAEGAGRLGDAVSAMSTRWLQGEETVVMLCDYTLIAR